MEETFSVIYNPVATGFSKKALDLLVKKFEDKGMTLVSCAKSEYAGHVIPLVKELDPVSDYLITFGGDGTANEAIRAFNEIEQKCTYAHISAGTTNDMALNYGLARHDPVKSIELLAEKGEVAMVDSIVVNGEAVSYVSAFGYIGPVPYLTSGKLKKALGHAAYVLRAMPIVFSRPEKFMVCYTANGETREVWTHMVLITTSKGMGGITLYPDCDLEDGRFEVFMLGEFSPSLIPKALKSYLRDDIDLSQWSDVAEVFSTDDLVIKFTEGRPKYEVDNDGDKAVFNISDSDNTLHYTLGKKIRVLKVKK